MTNTNLKAQIDNNITNETAPLGITPSDVGSNMKAVVDYVDQESALKVNKATGFSLLADTEISRLASMTAIFTTALKNTYDAAVIALTGKEDITNKSTNVTTDGASDSKYPSVKAIKTYVDANSGGSSYKVYTALLEFVDASTINSTVFENTIGDGSKDGINDIAWTYYSSTTPRARMTNAPFITNKTLCSQSVYNTSYFLAGLPFSTTECRFYSSNIITEAPSLSYVPFVFVEIRVYN